MTDSSGAAVVLRTGDAPESAVAERCVGVAAVAIADALADKLAVAFPAGLGSVGGPVAAETEPVEVGTAAESDGRGRG